MDFSVEEYKMFIDMTIESTQQILTFKEYYLWSSAVVLRRISMII